MENLIHKYLKDYKNNFDEIWKLESYKWEAIKCFQDNWDINADDFIEMLNNAFSKTYNLLNSRQYFPLAMVQRYAEKDSNKIKQMFIDLFDENTDVYLRISKFKNQAQGLCEKYPECGKNHYQTENSITTYLWLKYPDKYYIYKHGEIKSVAKKLESSYIFTKGDYQNNIYNHLAFYDEICNILQNDNELKNILHNHLNDECWLDSRLKTLTIDFGFYISRYSETMVNDLGDNDMTQKENLNLNIPLNQILYGPPGTGKTYHTDEYIREIIKNNIESNNTNLLDTYEGLTWYSVIALAMYKHKKDSYKVPELKEFEEIKQFSNNKDNSRIISQILWGQLQYHTAPDNKFVKYEKRHTPYIFEKMEHSTWRLTQEGKEFVEEQLSEYLDSKNTNKKEYSTFITFHQSYSYEEFVEGIKPQISSSNIDQENNEGKIIYTYSDGIFKDICKRANADPQNNYIIVIDEINRGNISKIFGELITLIEDDKRVTPNGELNFEHTQKKNNELLVKLPYSKESFGVPNNLYILGTVNTSDRSIASIDIALRRRFKFVEMMPQVDKVAKFNNGNSDFNFQEIFKELNKRISILLDRDHQIGHSYFIEDKYKDAGIDELKEIWFDSIMPLLNEYFYGDWEKLKLVIPGFIKSNDIPTYLKNECDEEKYYEFKTEDDFINNDNAERKDGFNDKLFIYALKLETFEKEDKQ